MEVTVTNNLHKSSNNLIEFIKLLKLNSNNLCIGLVYSYPVGHYLYIKAMNDRNYTIGYYLNHKISNPELETFVLNKLKEKIHFKSCWIELNEHYLLSRHIFDGLEVFPKEIVMLVMRKTIY